MKLDLIQKLLDSSISIAEQQPETPSYKEQSTFLLAALRFTETIHHKERKNYSQSMIWEHHRFLYGHAEIEEASRKLYSVIASREKMMR